MGHESGPLRAQNLIGQQIPLRDSTEIRAGDSAEFTLQGRRAFAVKVATKRLPVFPFSGLLKGCEGHKTHRFENGGTNQIRKTGKREVVLLPLPQTLYGP